MCCSLYSPESANVDIRYANERGITVTGIRDGRDHEAEKLFRELEQRAGTDALVLDLAKRLNYKTK